MSEKLTRQQHDPVLACREGTDAPSKQHYIAGEYAVETFVVRLVAHSRSNALNAFRTFICAPVMSLRRVCPPITIKPCIAFGASGSACACPIVRTSQAAFCGLVHLSVIGLYMGRRARIWRANVPCKPGGSTCTCLQMPTSTP